MDDDLHAYLRLTYYNALRTQPTPAAAFERAVQVMRSRRPAVSLEEARQEVGRALDIEVPAGHAAAQAASRLTG